MKKKCLWCDKRIVSLFGKYDEDSNICKLCLLEIERRGTEPVSGSYDRHLSVERNAHSKDILQPLKKDGSINKHFVEAHGTQSIEKNLKISKKQIIENVEKYG